MYDLILLSSCHHHRRRHHCIIVVIIIIIIIIIHIIINVVIIIIIMSNLCISQFQLRPAPTPPSRGYCGEFACLFSPGGVVGAFENFTLPGGRAFANPGAIPELLTRTWFPIRI